jgi:TPR repeat protein
MRTPPPKQSDVIEREEQRKEEEEKEDLSFVIDEIPVTGKRNTYKEDYLPEQPLSEPASVEEEVEEFEEIADENNLESIVDEEEEIEEKEPEKLQSKVSEEGTVEYAPISYIDQKLRNMRNQYPQVEESSERFESEERLLYMISLEGYTEADIEETIEKVFTLRNEGKLAEAAHLLLIAAATESLYAQFILARELYKGNILQKDLPEAFTQINRLALIDYPEAVCDLAQFYEYGIGIDKDKKKAFTLYEDALELGVQRAETHLSRMEEASRGILGKLFRRKH